MNEIPNLLIINLNKNISKKYIKFIFEKILGKDCLKEISIENKNIVNTAILKFNKMIPESEIKELILNRLNQNLDIKFVHNKYDIWKCKILKN